MKAFERSFHVLFVVCFFCVSLGLGAGACGPQLPTPNRSCQNDLECAGSARCIEGKCKLQPIVSAEVPADTPSANEKPSEPPKPGESISEPAVEPRIEPPTSEKSALEQVEPPHEQIPEVAPEVAPLCAEGQTRPCSHPCGEAVETCAGGKWGTCSPKEATRPCYEGSTTTKDKGECKSGVQTCLGDKWGPCEKQILPQAETCGDGKDNDCDGAVDEKDAGCLCKPGETQACGSNVGECLSGKQTCDASSQWGTCQGGVTPKAEICNGKDDNCDGQIDEPFPKRGGVCFAGIGECRTEGKFVCSTDGSGVRCDATPKAGTTELCDGKDNDCDGQVDESLRQACYTATTGCRKSGTTYQCLGGCRAGSQVCSGGKWGLCSGQLLPKPELCRDGKDNDCDGQADEICGAPLVFVQASAQGKVARQHTITNITTKYTRTTTGRYSLTNNSSSGRTCPKAPLILTANEGTVRTIDYYCSGDSYIISTTTRGGRLYADTALSAVIPVPSIGEVWGVMRSPIGNCPLGKCKLSIAYGGPTLTRSTTGVFTLSSSACSSSLKPYFTTVILENGLFGHAHISYTSSGKCTIATFDGDGKAADRGFAFWIPSPKKYAWAIMGRTGTVSASNGLGESWKTKPLSGKYNDIYHPSFASPSAVLLSPHLRSTAAGGVAQVNVLSGGARVIFTLVGSSGPSFVTHSILFMQ